MTDQAMQHAPRVQARIGGFLYMIIIGAAFVAEMFIRGPLIVSDDVLATAHNIVESEIPYRAAIGIDLLVLFCDTVVALILFVVLKPAGASTALLAAFFRLVFVAIMGANVVTALAPLLLLKGGSYLAAFTTEQLQGLAMLSLKLRDVGYNVGLVFFGAHCVIIGALVAKSGLLPRAIGMLMMIAGVCYLVNSFNNLLPRELAAPLFPLILLPGLVAESALALWLFFVGLNVRRWEALANSKPAALANEL